MANRMSNRLVALCAVAIGGIYAAGYGVTESSAQSLTPAGSTELAARTAPSTSVAPNKSNSSRASSGQSSQPSSTTSGTSKANSSTNPNQNGSSSGSSGSSTSSTATSNTQSSKQKVKYHDGTFQGTGTNPYGTVAVSLKVQNGKINSVQITECTTHYPESVINPVLPNMVVQKQTWRVYIITGATASTYAFAEAVYNALQLAQK